MNTLEKTHKRKESKARPTRGRAEQTGTGSERRQDGGAAGRRGGDGVERSTEMTEMKQAEVDAVV